MSNFIKAVYISLLLVFAGFFVNAFVGVKASHDEFVKNSLIYVFVAPQSNQQEISQRLSEFPQIASLEFITNERVFETAISEKPDLKDILDVGQNPFFSYFVVKPMDVTDESAKYITKFAAQLPGVSSVKYDTQIFLYAQKIGNYIRYFSQFCIWSIVVAFIGMLFFYFWKHRFIRADYKNYIFYKSFGMIIGALVSAAFYLLALYIGGIFNLWPNWYYYAAPVLLGATFAIMFFDIE